MKLERFFVLCLCVTGMLAAFVVGRELPRPELPAAASEIEMSAEAVEEHDHHHGEQPTFAASADSDDPHQWPEWHHFRSDWIKSHPDCEWNGCTKGGGAGSGMNVHHGIAANWCVKSGHPEMVYTDGHGQWFLTLCRDHHELAHDVCPGCGGNWSKFNPDSKADAKAGKWNSRGKSAWPFKSEAEAIHWINGRVSAHE